MKKKRVSQRLWLCVQHGSGYVHMDPFLVAGQPDFIHINIRDPKVLIFRAQSVPEIQEKKRKMARRANAIDTQGT